MTMQAKQVVVIGFSHCPICGLTFPLLGSNDICHECRQIHTPRKTTFTPLDLLDLLITEDSNANE